MIDNESYFMKNTDDNVFTVLDKKTGDIFWVEPAGNLKVDDILSKNGVYQTVSQNPVERFDELDKVMVQVDNTKKGFPVTVVD